MLIFLRQKREQNGRSLSKISWRSTHLSFTRLLWAVSACKNLLLTFNEICYITIGLSEHFLMRETVSLKQTVYEDMNFKSGGFAMNTNALMAVKDAIGGESFCRGR